MRHDVIQRTNIVQQQRSKQHDRFIKERKFHPGYLALLFYSKFKDFQGKFQTHWLQPYEIETVFDNFAVRIRTIDEEKVTFLVNGHRLRIYCKPLIRKEFAKHIQDNIDLKVVRKDSPSSPTWLTKGFCFLKKK